MARTAKTFTLVKISGGELTADHYANADALRDALAHVEDEANTQMLVFVGEPVDFTIDRTPRVVLGSKPTATKTRKPRAKKQGTKVDSAFFEKPTSGASAEKQE